MAESLSRGHEELLERARRLGERDQAVERGAGLPACFLNKARRGEREGPRAVDSWSRLAAWLSGRGAPTPSAGAPTASPPDQPVAAPSSSSSDADPPPPPELLEALRSVSSGEELLEIDRQIFVLAAERKLAPGRAKALTDVSKEVRQALELARGERTEQVLEELVPMTRDEAEDFWRAREARAKAPLGPGEGAPPPTPPPTPIKEPLP